MDIFDSMGFLNQVRPVTKINKILNENFKFEPFLFFEICL